MENNKSHQPPQLPNSVSIFERIANSVVVKLGVIFVLTLLMLIPMSMVNDLIEERKYREQDVSSEIAAKWGKDQVITSPVLAVPYDEINEAVEKTSDGKERIVKSVSENWVYVLPNKINIITKVYP